ncbi:unnamed protein product [Psylliodes chrysocephalus]|uniref:Uncharacterized protein n=1 Tax=Psylliodes chrysocephalus TaxID=3402493 RepID=A0A9P0CXA4_9CUCU|nr:unnamed protein product [Psylliodes chrysocephala]
MICQTFNNIKLKHTEKVIPRLAVRSTVKVHEKKVPIGPVLLFQHMSITKTFEDKIEKCFEYELTSYPFSLFNALVMRKTPKSAIYNCFKSVNAEVDTTNATYIIYGHRVTIVFDGYSESTKNIKAAEQCSRITKTSSCSDIIFDPSFSKPTTISC